MMTWIGWLVGAAVAAWVIGAIVYASWLRHEAKAHREMEQRKRLEALINLSSQPPRASGLASERKAVS